MNVFYEESGDFKVGTVLTDNITSYQVEAPHGKRSKVKANAVMFRFEESTANFLVEAQKIADEIDIDFLWQSSSQEEFSFDALAKEYFGRAPKPYELGGILLRLHNAPIYFYKKGKGHYRAAPEESLKAALAGIEKKRLLMLKQESYAQQLRNSSIPEEFKPIINQMLYAPDRSSIEFKALDQVCEETHLSTVKLLERCGVVPSSHDYHFNRFMFENFRGGTGFGEIEEIIYPDDLPLSSTQAFSIDSSLTTEIDDAFSVTRLDNGNLQIGIHIAAPALAIAPDSNVDCMARQRLSTVYIPGKKITMLPDSLIESFSLNEGKMLPVVSLYVESDADFNILGTQTRVERITIASNLRYDLLEQQFDLSDLNALDNLPYQKELKALFDFALHWEELRGKQEINYIDYNFDVVDDRIVITERKRGSVLDKIVSELMIFTNTTWATLLSERAPAAVYRTRSEGKVKTSLVPEVHEGIGVSQYVWATSPLRRYIDLVNQRQLIAIAQNQPAPYSADNETLNYIKQNFEFVYSQYDEFQKTMERYWCLRWLLQEAVTDGIVVVIKENLVRFEKIPLYTRVIPMPEISPGKSVKVRVSNIDLLELSLHCHFDEILESV
jgi:exoribonuclease-2